MNCWRLMNAGAADGAVPAAHETRRWGCRGGSQLLVVAAAAVAEPDHEGAGRKSLMAAQDTCVGSMRASERWRGVCLNNYWLKSGCKWHALSEHAFLQDFDKWNILDRRQIACSIAFDT